MRNMIQVIGGVLLAAVTVLLIVNFSSGEIFSNLKNGAKKSEQMENVPGEAYEKAVLASPNFVYIGELAKEAGKVYDVFGEIQVTDSIDNYEKSLKEAVTEGRIYVQNIEIREGGKDGLKETDADIDVANGKLLIRQSGIYQIKIKGMDVHNNPVKTEFLLAVNRKGGVR
jgi:hypothetical protein